MSGVIGKKTVPVASLKNWEKNPRYIKDPKDFEALKRQIKSLGDYKPLIVANDEVTVLGGNMRLRAYKELGKKEIDIVIVDAPDDATRLQYMLSDNQQVGSYSKEDLTELVYGSDIPVEDLEPFEVEMADPIPIMDFLSELGPDLKEEKKKRERGPREVTCPDCGSMFEI